MEKSFDVGRSIDLTYFFCAFKDEVVPFLSIV